MSLAKNPRQISETRKTSMVSASPFGARGTWRLSKREGDAPGSAERHRPDRERAKS